MLAYVSPYAPNTLQRLNRAAIPGFSSPESCSAVLEALHITSQPLKAGASQPSVQLPDVSGLPQGAIDEAAAKQLFAEAGIAVPPSRVVHTREEAERAASEVGAPVVLKVLDANLLHKSDIGGVALHLNADTIGDRLEQMTHQVKSHVGRRPDAYLVEAMVSGGHELILGPIAMPWARPSCWVPVASPPSYSRTPPSGCYRPRAVSRWSRPGR
ncbi:acetate--CoA ligase family protein [Billgrantia tianxiuensis]|uniref:acetate--CoA ligase family protein n=1 Tax=Billgrantia tianxiuensis TaxID=2497861 RepID=UPI001915F1C9|nr:acetate--CoA ligase family protein [Halomonas tianxiuensis]